MDAIQRRHATSPVWMSSAGPRQRRPPLRPGAVAHAVDPSHGMGPGDWAPPSPTKRLFSLPVQRSACSSIQLTLPNHILPFFPRFKASEEFISKNLAFFLNPILPLKYHSLLFSIQEKSPDFILGRYFKPHVGECGPLCLSKRNEIVLKFSKYFQYFPGALRQYYSLLLVCVISLSVFHMSLFKIISWICPAQFTSPSFIPLFLLV